MFAAELPELLRDVAEGGHAVVVGVALEQGRPRAHDVRVVLEQALPGKVKEKKLDAIDPWVAV